MSFSDHKITQFTHRITDLPDQPNLPADELKARFDSSPEELRAAHNAVCDDAARLEARVEGIVVDTFGDTIDKSMLSTELAAELDAKAEAVALTAETTTRAAETASLGSRMSTAESTITTHTSQIAQKCQIYYGTFTGDGKDSQIISLGFTPKAVLVVAYGFVFSINGGLMAGLAATGYPAQETPAEADRACAVVTNGFQVYNHHTAHGNYNVCLNWSGQEYTYLVFR